MIIGFDISPLSDGNTHRGVGTYTRRLLEALHEEKKNHDIVTFDSVHPIRRQVDVIHYPYFDVFRHTLPLIRVNKTIVTVHDLIPIVFSERFPPGIKGSIEWAMQRFSLQTVSAVITDSFCSKADIHRLVGISEQKIYAIPLAPSIEHSRTARVSTYMQHKRGAYFLYVGDVNWNKNIPGLIRAFVRFINERNNSLYRLVLVGESFLDSGISEVREIQRLIKELHVESAIDMPGYVSAESLTHYYEDAIGYIQPSYYEGFGLPVIEAMASGCPVASSRGGSLGEIDGYVATFKPDNQEEIVEAFRALVGLSPKRRASIIQQGKKYARTFSWNKTALATIQVYESVR